MELNLLMSGFADANYYKNCFTNKIEYLEANGSKLALVALSLAQQPLLASQLRKSSEPQVSLRITNQLQSS